MGGRGRPRASYRRAIRDLGEALRVDPRSPEALSNRGLAWSGIAEADAAVGMDAAGPREKAIADLHAAVVANPSFWQAWANLGLLHDAAGQPAKAVEAYDAALQICPGHPKLEELLAAARARLGPPPGKEPVK